MLSYISVKNLTVIESASLEFGSGLNVITGETGAGKSVLVGALKFLMGDRLNRAVLRDASQKLAVEGIFTATAQISDELKDQYDIDGEVILSRESDAEGKNKVFINGRAAPVTKLKEVSEYLIDIHGQHEHQVLFEPARHLSFVDFFVDKKLKENYLENYRQYRAKLDKLNELKSNLEETAKLREMYEFQVEEITSANINLEKDLKIDEQIEFLSHIEKIREATALCLNLLKDGEVSAQDLVSKAERSLSSVFKLAPELTKAADSLNNAGSYIKDAVGYIESAFEGQQSSPDELNSLIDRKYKLANLIKKYGGSLEEVIKYKEKIEDNLLNSSLGSEGLKKLEEDVDALKIKAQETANVLNDSRKSASENISKRVVDILKELELPQSRFEVKFSEFDKLDSAGGVSAEFFISTNAGFNPGPLASVASGGEVSRVMLALKEVFAEADGINTLLFDEIDTGISGKAAKSVAEKLANLSKTKQIIVITHLPVVAAKGASHFHITKSEVDGLSKTEIRKLDDKSRQAVIATMIAGEATQTSISQAKDLLSGESN